MDRENPDPIVNERFNRLRIEEHNDFIVWGLWVGECPHSVGGAIVSEWVARCEPKPLIIIDSFIAFHEGSENDSQAIRSHMMTYRSIAAAGSTVILLHHPGKSETAQDYRGSSDIVASVDIAYKLVSLGDGATLSLLGLQTLKQRIQVNPPHCIRYRDGEFIPEAEQVGGKTSTEMFVELLKANPGIGVKAFQSLATQNKLGRNEGNKFLSAGVKRGTVKRVVEGTKHRHFWAGVSTELDHFSEPARSTDRRPK